MFNGLGVKCNLKGQEIQRGYFSNGTFKHADDLSKEEKRIIKHFLGTSEIVKKHYDKLPNLIELELKLLLWKKRVNIDSKQDEKKVITYLRVEQYFIEYLYKYHDVPYIKRTKAMERVESSRRRIQNRGKDLRKIYDGMYGQEILQSRIDHENISNTQKNYDSPQKTSSINET